MKEPKYPVHTVMKAIEIINFLAKDTTGRGATISDIDRALGMGKSTIHRLLDTLLFYDYIEKDDETCRYRLGWELYKIGQVLPQQNQLSNISQNLLIDLNSKTGEVVNYGFLKKNETVIVSKIEGVQSNLQVSINPGVYEAIHATAIGKMTISEFDAAEIKELLGGTDSLPAYTPNTITTMADFLQEVKITRQRGYASDTEELCIGLCCIAMPIRNYTGKIVAAVSVSMPTARMNEEKKRTVLKHLKETTRKISETLGYRP